MSPVTHCLAGWVLANTARLDRRDRAVVTIGGVAPDADSLGIVAELLTRNSEKPLLLWSTWHHVLCHNIGFALLTVFAAAAVARRKLRHTRKGVTSFHLHLLGDLAGARGPDGYQWPVPYFRPFSDTPRLAWQGQWALNGWQNMVLTALLVSFVLYLSWKKGFSPLEMCSKKADAAFVGALRQRLGSPPTARPVDTDLCHDMMSHGPALPRGGSRAGLGRRKSRDTDG